MYLTVTKVVSTIFHETPCGADYILKMVLKMATKAFTDTESEKNSFLNRWNTHTCLLKPLLGQTQKNYHRVRFIFL